MTGLAEFRKTKDAFFGSDPESPFSAEERKTFKGLKYFPENLGLKYVVPVQEFPVKETIHMQTSTGTVQTYQRYGVVKIKVDGKDVELTIYHNENGFFLPFVDGLAGKETYPAGRYLEPEPAGKGKILVDFNLAYNPYCAYNDMWSCPLTPFENHLKMAIRAGEKIFHDEALGD
jgi:uncharacterized protein